MKTLDKRLKMLYLYFIKQTQITQDMNAIYTNMEEVADLYINSGEKNAADLNVLVREIGQKFVVKYGKECAGEVVAKYRATIRTKDGLAGFLTDMKVEEVRFSNVFTGELNSLFVSIR